MLDYGAVWEFVNTLAAFQDPLTNYLIHNNDQDVQTLTLNDYTYITNRLKTVAMAETVAPIKPPEAYLELKKVAYASQYSVNLYNNLDTVGLSTATRLKVEREVDSSNGCTGSDPVGGDPPAVTLW